MLSTRLSLRFFRSGIFHLALLFAGIVNGLAQTTDEDKPFRQAVERFVTAIRYVQHLKTVARTAAETEPNARTRELLRLLASAPDEQLRPLVVQTFAAILLADEAVELAEFYESALGQKILAKTTATVGLPPGEFIAAIRDIPLTDDERAVVNRLVQSDAYRELLRAVTSGKFQDLLDRNLSQAAVFDDFKRREGR